MEPFRDGEIRGIRAANNDGSPYGGALDGAAWGGIEARWLATVDALQARLAAAEARAEALEEEHQRALDGAVFHEKRAHDAEARAAALEKERDTLRMRERDLFTRVSFASKQLPEFDLAHPTVVLTREQLCRFRASFDVLVRVAAMACGVEPEALVADDLHRLRARAEKAEAALREVVEALDGAISIRCAEPECGGECVREALAKCRAALTPAPTPPAPAAESRKGEEPPPSARETCPMCGCTWDHVEPGRSVGPGLAWIPCDNATFHSTPPRAPRDATGERGEG